MEYYPSVRSIFKAYVRALAKATDTVQPEAIHEKYFDAMYTLGATSRQTTHLETQHVVTTTELIKPPEMIRTIVQEPLKTGTPIILTLQYARKGRVLQEQSFGMIPLDAGAATSQRPLKEIYTAYLQRLTTCRDAPDYYSTVITLLHQMWEAGVQPAHAKVHLNGLEGDSCHFPLGKEAVDLIFYKDEKEKEHFFQRVQYHLERQLQESKEFSIWIKDQVGEPTFQIEERKK